MAKKCTNVVSQVRKQGAPKKKNRTKESEQSHQWYYGEREKKHIN